jgi:hypothetical protein
MEEQRIKKTRATVQKQRQENAKNKAATIKTNTIPFEFPQPFENTWLPCASLRGIKLLISTTCASHYTLKSGDFIGAYLQAKVIGHHFVRLPLEYAYYFPEYAKYFGRSQPFEDTWLPCASSRGVKLLMSTTCSSHHTLKSGDFIGAYLQAQVIGRHFVRLSLEYASFFPEYAIYFGTPSLLNKRIYELVYSGKYWNTEYSEWLYSKGFIQSQAEPSFFVYFNKHNK